MINVIIILSHCCPILMFQLLFFNASIFFISFWTSSLISFDCFTSLSGYRTKFNFFTNDVYDDDDDGDNDDDDDDNLLNECM